MLTAEEYLELAIQAIKSGDHVKGDEYIYKSAELGNSIAIDFLAELKRIELLKGQLPQNQLGLVDDFNINSQHVIQDISQLMERDLIGNINNLRKITHDYSSHTALSELLLYYTIDNLLEYYQKARYLPFGVVVQVKKLVIKAFKNISINKFETELIIETYEKILEEAIWDIDIVYKNTVYMNRLNS
jgi:hypothetical protein